MAGPVTDRNLDIALRIKAELDQARGQLDQFNRSLDNTSKSAGGSMRATQAQTAALNDLLGKIDPTIAKLDQLDKQQAKLRSAKAAGLIDDEGFARFNAAIEKQRADLDKAGEAMHGFSLNTAQARREVGYLVKDIATGQYGRFEQSFATLASNSGLLSLALSPLGLAIGSVVGTLGLFAAAALKGAAEEAELNREIIATGNYAGVTAAGMRELADSISGPRGSASEAIKLLVSSGQVAGDRLQEAGQAAVDLATVTGVSIEKAVADIVKLQGDPVAAVKALDAQYNLLTLQQYENIKALQAQGDADLAASLAQTSLAQELAGRAAEVRQNLGLLERAWAEVRDTASDAWEAMKGIGRTSTNTDDFNAAGKQLQAIKDRLPTTKGLSDQQLLAAASNPSDPNHAYFAGDLGTIQQLVAQRNASQAGAQFEDWLAQTQADNTKITRQAKEASDTIDGYLKSAKSDQAKAEEIAKVKAATAKLIAADPNGKAGYLADEQTALAYIDKKYRPPKVKDTSNELASSQKQLQDQILQLGSTAIGPVTAIWDKYTQAMLNAATAGGKAIKSGGDVAAVQAQVSQVQTLAAQARDKALADQQRGLQIAYLQATGQQAQAAKLQLEAQYGSLLADLQARGDAAGVKLVKSLINVGEARAQLQELQAQVNQVLADQSRQEQEIQAEQQAGLISEYTARKQIIALHQQTAGLLDELLPKYRDLVGVVGDPRSVNGLKQVEAEVGRLKLQANDLKTAFDSGLTSGLEQALVGLSNRTLTVAGAFRTLASTVAQSLAQVAARALAAKAVEAIGNLFGGSKKQTADVGAGAVKLTVAGGVLGAASTLLGTNADKLSAAAAALLVANTVGAVGGFAEGGFTGPGGKYQVRGIVHAGEYVQPQYRMAEPGALAFMRDFHSHGMAAIAAWSTPPGYADGGYVNPLSAAPAPALLSTPRARMPAVAANDGRAGQPFGVRVALVDDPSHLPSVLNGPVGEDAFIFHLKRNVQTVRQLVNR